MNNKNKVSKALRTKIDKAILNIDDYNEQINIVIKYCKTINRVMDYFNIVTEL
jgi:hypothetical protein